MDIKKIVPSINKHIKEGIEYIEPSENAHMGLCVPEIIFKYGGIKNLFKIIHSAGKYMSGSIKQLKKSYRELYDQPQNAKLQISDTDLMELKAFIINMGIGEIGFTEVDTAYIFDDKKIIYENAIVILMGMNLEAIKTAPSKVALKEIWRTYYELNVAVNKIKYFLNSRGYNAQAGPALGGEVNYPLLAQKAGMGAIGRHGLLITPRFGPSLRLAAVYTDIENLPFEDTNEHMWINQFCNTCNNCVRKCPAKAIYKEPKVFDDGSEEHIDYRKCAVPFSNNNGCTVCVKECAFFKSDYDKIKENFLQ